MKVQTISWFLFLGLLASSCHKSKSSTPITDKDQIETNLKDKDSSKPDKESEEENKPSENPNSEAENALNNNDFLIAEESGASTVGNGGDAVVCFKPGTRQVQSVQLLDYYEAKARWNLDVQLDGKGFVTPYARVWQAIDRVEQFDSQRARLLKFLFLEFQEEAKYWHGIRLPNIDDAEVIAIPNGCEITQIARQQKSNLSGESDYIIAGDLFNLMDDTHKAGLILHEIFYREFVTRGQTISTNARYFNAMVSANKVKNIHQYMRLLTETGLPFLIGIQSADHIPNFIEIDLKRASWVDDQYSLAAGKIAKIRALSLNRDYLIKVRQVEFNHLDSTPLFYYEFDLSESVYIDREGHLISAKIENVNTLSMDPKWCVNKNLDRNNQPMRAYFYPSGQFKEIRSDKGSFSLCAKQFFPREPAIFPMTKVIFNSRGDVKFFHFADYEDNHVYLELNPESRWGVQENTEFAHLCNGSDVFLFDTFGDHIIGKFCKLGNHLDKNAFWAEVDQDKGIIKKYSEDEAKEAIKLEMEKLYLN